MNKEQFGMQLYDAIQINSQRLQCLKHGDDGKAEVLWTELEAMLLQLQPEEVDRILAMTGEETLAIPYGAKPYQCECCHAQSPEIQYSSLRGGWTCLSCHAGELTCCQQPAKS